MGILSCRRQCVHDIDIVLLSFLLHFSKDVDNFNREFNVVCLLPNFLVLDKRMVEDLLPTDPFLLVHYQTLLDEVLGVLAQFGIVREGQRGI